MAVSLLTFKVPVTTAAGNIFIPCHTIVGCGEGYYGITLVVRVFGLGVLMGKFCQFLTYACYMSVFLV